MLHLKSCRGALHVYAPLTRNDRELTNLKCKYSYIVPLLRPKDMRAKALTFDGFRTITISPIVLKVFEYCILNNYGDILYSADNQFGFKKVQVAATLFMLYEALLNI